MAYEVELKAHVEDPLLIQERLQQLEGISLALYEHKDDIYYALGDEEPSFRLRRESFGKDEHHLKGSLLFTKKNKSITKGIEVNKEYEFTVPDDQFEAAHAFCLSLGYGIYIRKTKRGNSYTLGNVHIELVEVIGLGWFLEMECVLENETGIEDAKASLKHILGLVGVSEDKIESRYYMHLLKELVSFR